MSGSEQNQRSRSVSTTISSFGTEQENVSGTASGTDNSIDSFKSEQVKSANASARRDWRPLSGRNYTANAFVGDELRCNTRCGSTTTDIVKSFPATACIQCKFGSYLWSSQSECWLLNKKQVTLLYNRTLLNKRTNLTGKRKHNETVTINVGGSPVSGKEVPIRAKKTRVDTEENASTKQKCVRNRVSAMPTTPNPNLDPHSANKEAAVKAKKEAAEQKAKATKASKEAPAKAANAETIKKQKEKEAAVKVKREAAEQKAKATTASREAAAKAANAKTKGKRKEKEAAVGKEAAIKAKKEAAAKANKKAAANVKTTKKTKEKEPAVRAANEAAIKAANASREAPAKASKEAAAKTANVEKNEKGKEKEVAAKATKKVTVPINVNLKSTLTRTANVNKNKKGKVKRAPRCTSKKCALNTTTYSRSTVTNKSHPLCPLLAGELSEGDGKVDPSKLDPRHCMSNTLHIKKLVSLTMNVAGSAHDDSEAKRFHALMREANGPAYQAYNDLLRQHISNAKWKLSRHFLWEFPVYYCRSATVNLALYRYESEPPRKDRNRTSQWRIGVVSEEGSLPDESVALLVAKALQDDQCFPRKWTALVPDVEANKSQPPSVPDVEGNKSPFSNRKVGELGDEYGAFDIKVTKDLKQLVDEESRHAVALVSKWLAEHHELQVIASTQPLSSPSHASSLLT